MMRQDYLIERKLNTKPTTSAEKLIFLFPESRKQLVDTIFGTFFAAALPKESRDEAHNAKSLIAFISYRLNDDENCIRDFKFILALNKDDNEIFVDFCKKNALRYRTAWREFRRIEDDADYDTVLPVLQKFVGNQSNQHKKTVTFAGNQEIIDALGQADAHTNYGTDDLSLCRLFVRLFGDAYKFNAARKGWMYYDGTRWQDDIGNLRIATAAKTFSDAVQVYAAKTGDTDYLKNVFRLTSARTRDVIVKDARDLSCLDESMLDSNDYLLNCRNCVLDLSGNEPQLLSHAPDQQLSKVCAAEYNPEAQCPLWDKFLSDIMQGDTEQMRYLQKIAGLALTGNTCEECFFMLFGRSTRNGKSTFVETLLALLGDYGLQMMPETLAKKNTDSRNASGDVARLKNTRLVICSEPPKRMVFDVSLLKSLVGNDSITARKLYESEVTFKPKFKMLMNTNYLPVVNDTTFFSGDKVRVIEFNLHFKPEERDKGLKCRLLSELPGILNWCVRGWFAYRTEGLKSTQAVLAATAEYENDSDKLGKFISDCLAKVPTSNVSIKDAYARYAEWCDDCGYGCENKGSFVDEIKARKIFAASGTIAGKTVRNVIKGYAFSAENEEIPFQLQ